MTRSGLAEQGHRFVYRGGEFTWTHPATMRPTDVDCTDMNDEEFEAYVRSVMPPT